MKTTLNRSSQKVQSPANRTSPLVPRYDPAISIGVPHHQVKIRHRAATPCMLNLFARRAFKYGELGVFGVPFCDDSCFRIQDATVKLRIASRGTKTEACAMKPALSRYRRLWCFCSSLKSTKCHIATDNDECGGKTTANEHAECLVA